MAETPQPKPDDGRAILDTLLKAITPANLAATRNTATITGSSIEGTVQAYAALSEAAGKVAARLPDGEGAILLQTAESVPALSALRALQARLTRLESQFEAAIERAQAALAPPGGTGTRTVVASAAAAAAVVPIASIVGSLASAVFAIAGQLRTETKLEHAAVTLDDRALLAATAEQLRQRKPGRRVILSALLPLIEPHGDDPLLRRLGSLDGQAQEAAGLAERIGDALKALADAAPPQRKTLVEAQAALDIAAKGHAVVTTALAGMEESSPVALALQGAALDAELGQDGLVLAVKVLAGSSATRSERDFVEHAGGVVLTFTLFDVAGQVLASGIEDHITRFMTARDLRRLPRS